MIVSTLFAIFTYLFLGQEQVLTEDSNSTAMIRKYIALGASDAVGVGSSNPKTEGWVPKFAALINAKETLNYGRSGSLLSDAVRDQLPKVFEQKPNVITIWLAVNDFNRQVYNPSILTSYKTNLNHTLSVLREKLDSDTRILVGNIPDLAQVSIYSSFGISKDLLSAQVKQWNAAISDIVEKNKCDLVDLYAHWKELALHPEYISLDGFHPSNDGYTRLAEIFYQKFSNK